MELAALGVARMTQDPDVSVTPAGIASRSSVQSDDDPAKTCHTTGMAFKRTCKRCNGTKWCSIWIGDRYKDFVCFCVTVTAERAAIAAERNS